MALTTRSIWPEPLARYGSLSLVLLFATLVRTNFLWGWQRPYDVHHIDEHFLPYEALALWEGVTPRELGWPASTTRVLLSSAYFLDMILNDRSALLDNRASLPNLMDTIARWSYDRLDEPERLYRIGRWLSACLGLLQVAASYWAIRRWFSARAGLVGALCCAISPVLVEFSQLLLTDILGVLIVTLLMGALGGKSPWSNPSSLRAGLLLGLAVATKYHFAIWLVPALVSIWLRDASRDSGAFFARLRWSSILIAAAMGSFLLLVPWAWTNPLLIAKEIASIATYAAGSGQSAPKDPFANIAIAMSGFGWLAIVGLLPGILSWKGRMRLGLPIVALLATSILVVASSGRMYSRWGMLFFPAIALVSAEGYDIVISSARGRPARIALATALSAVLLLGVRQLVISQAAAGEVDACGAAHRWIMGNMKPGESIAVDSLYSRNLPHARGQLETMLAGIMGPASYARKMESNGMTPPTTSEPFRLAVLNDEFYTAHWLRRELAYRAESEGFDVIMYDNSVKYGCITTDQAINLFLRGLISPGDGCDALLLNEPRNIGIEPDRVFGGGRGPTYFLYLRRPPSPVSDPRARTN